MGTSTSTEFALQLIPTYLKSFDSSAQDLDRRTKIECNQTDGAREQMQLEKLEHKTSKKLLYSFTQPLVKKLKIFKLDIKLLDISLNILTFWGK